MENIKCPHPVDREVFLGKSAGIGLLVGFVCGGVLVSIFFFAYRSSYIQNLIAERFAKKEPESTAKSVKERKNELHYRMKFQNKKPQQEEGITNMNQTDHQNAENDLYVTPVEITGHHQNTDAQPIYENMQQRCDYESDYDYATPAVARGWLCNEAEDTGGYVHMHSPHLHKA